MDDEPQIGLWYSTNGGRNIDALGPENGYILRDEELGDPEEPEDADARITLEHGRVENPGFFVTAQLYGGWFFVTLCRSTQSHAATQLTRYIPSPPVPQSPRAFDEYKHVA